jgi:glycosyltransferase involved in cell wall biosynthesis
MNISVVVPSHNNEQWLKDCISSINQQKADSIESIFVLDNNSDNSQIIIKKYAKNFKIYETTFGNAASARNFGVQKAKHEWIAFLDGDDYWTQDHLSNAIKCLKNSEHVAYFVNFKELYEGNGEFFVKNSASDIDHLSEFTGEEFYKLFLASNPGWPTSGMIVNRKRFLEVGGFDEKQLRRHDTEMFSRVVYGQKWTYNPAVGFIYRKNVPDAISNDRPSCSYFRLLADIKICNLYGLKRGEYNLHRRAEIALSEQFLLGLNREHQKKTLELALPFLKGRKLIFYKTVGWNPFICRCLLTFFKRLKMSTRNVSEN